MKTKANEVKEKGTRMAEELTKQIAAKKSLQSAKATPVKSLKRKAEELTESVTPSSKVLAEGGYCLASLS